MSYIPSPPGPPGHPIPTPTGDQLVVRTGPGVLTTLGSLTTGSLTLTYHMTGNDPGDYVYVTMTGSQLAAAAIAHGFGSVQSAISFLAATLLPPANVMNRVLKISYSVTQAFGPDVITGTLNQIYITDGVTPATFTFSPPIDLTTVNAGVSDIPATHPYLSVASSIAGDNSTVTITGSVVAVNPISVTFTLSDASALGPFTINQARLNVDGNGVFSWYQLLGVGGDRIPLGLSVVSAAISWPVLYSVPSFGTLIIQFSRQGALIKGLLGQQTTIFGIGGSAVALATDAPSASNEIEYGVQILP